MSAVPLPHRRTNPAIDLAMTETVVACIRAERDLVRATRAMRAALTPTAQYAARRALSNARMVAASARYDVATAIAAEGRDRA